MKPVKILSKAAKKIDWLIVVILALGLFYRLLVTANGNFIFHIDSARDMLAVREIVELHNFRLIGHTTGIDGLFTGPLWFYLLTIPFIISGGNPYANILFMHFFWFIGGYFLLWMMKKRGTAAFIASGALWIASNYLLLASVYSFNPNPVTFLSPVFIYCLAKYLETGKLKFALPVGIFIGFFWNLEIALGLFSPFIILFALIFSRKIFYLKTKQFWIGVAGPGVLAILPQILFEFRNNFFMSRSVYQYIAGQKSLGSTFNLQDRYQHSIDIFFEGFRGTFMNQQIIIYTAVFLFLVSVIIMIKIKKNDLLLLSAILLAIIPFLGFIFFPLAIQRWHVDAALAALIPLTGFSLGYIQNFKSKKYTKYFRLSAIGISVLIAYFAFLNLHLMENFNLNRPSSDPAIFKNQIAAIDYVYNQAQGKNFKVYVYSPAIIDLGYQYNFWWYGQNTRYGFLPKDYAYLPNQPEYVKYKDQYSNGKNPDDSGLVILIKEPGNPPLEDLWKNSFTNLQLLKSEKVGPLEIEVRKNVK